MDAFLNDFNNDIYVPFSDVTDFTIGDLNSNYIDTVNSLVQNYYINIKEEEDRIDYSQLIVNYYNEE
jgi:hypothetical protein